MARMTSAEGIEALQKFGITCSPRELASVIGGNPYYYNMAARNGTLEFDFAWRGRNLRIFTASVIKMLGGKIDVQAGTDC